VDVKPEPDERAEKHKNAFKVDKVAVFDVLPSRRLRHFHQIVATRLDIANEV
jgi:hypothetical protein